MVSSEPGICEKIEDTSSNIQGVIIKIKRLGENSKLHCCDIDYERYFSDHKYTYDH